jgi:hypothetical protein
MRELPSPGTPDECPRCQRKDVGLYVVTGAGDDHRHLCPDCLSTVARLELPRHDRRIHDPRADPANCAEAVLHEAASGTDREAALEHGLAAVNELARRVDAALADAALKIAEIATARAGAYADMYPEGAGMVAAYDDLIEELKEELIPAGLEQLRANENTLDALGRQIRQLQTQLAKRRWPRVVRELPDGPQFIRLDELHVEAVPAREFKGLMVLPADADCVVPRLLGPAHGPIITTCTDRSADGSWKA